MPKEEAVKGYQLVSVSTSSELAIQNPEGEVLSVAQALVDILNKLDKLETILK